MGLTHVSIHAPAWGRLLVVTFIINRIRFQSTPPHGGRPDWTCFSRMRRCLIHAPAWGATDTFLLDKIVSIHAPAGGRPGILGIQAGWLFVFHPRPRMGATEFIARYPSIQHGQVSIHAPAWGRRRAVTRIRNDTSKIVSIHAPAWGDTNQSIYLQLIRISIHAPAWGRRQSHGSLSSRTCFIHAPAWGRRIIAHDLDHLCGRCCFNPRPRMGATAYIINSIHRRDVNPRPRMGRRESFTAVISDLICFNHAPAWGATQRGDRALGRDVSIHAPAWGRRGAVGVSISVQRHSTFSIHVPGGRRMLDESCHGLSTEVNPRPPHGGDLSSSIGVQCVRISIHAPAWGDISVAKIVWIGKTGRFNPRPRMGATSSSMTRQGYSCLIHAPAWGDD